MASRLLSDKICMSESLANISDGAEILFYRLISLADDFGRYYGHPKLIASSCFPFGGVSESDIKKRLIELKKEGIIAIYKVDGRAYLEICKWSKYQKPRSARSKYPAPTEGKPLNTNNGDGLQQVDTNCDEIVTPCNNLQQIARYNDNDNDNDNDISLDHLTDDPPLAPPPDDFDRFWAAYPRKVVKKTTRRTWDKLKPDPDTVEAILNGLEQWKKTPQWQNPQYIPHPTTFLSQERWKETDELPIDSRAAPDYSRDSDFFDD